MQKVAEEEAEKKDEELAASDKAAKESKKLVTEESKNKIEEEAEAEKAAEKVIAEKEKEEKTAEKEKKNNAAVNAAKIKEETKKEEFRRESSKKAIPKPAVKKAAVDIPKPKAVGSGTAAAIAKQKSHDEKKKELYATSKMVTKPKEKHDDIHALLDQAAAAQNPTTTSIHEHHDWNMSQSGVHEKIATEYPIGVTEEVYMKGNKEITERVVVKDGTGSIYWKVKHSWGGVYYFKNANLSISPVEFDIFTRVKDEDGNVIEPYHINRVKDH